MPLQSRQYEILKDLIGKLKADIPVEFILTRLGAEPLNSNNQTLCIFHSDTKPSLSVYEENRRYYCYGCERGGDILDAIGEIHSCPDDRMSQIKILSELMGEDYLSQLYKNMDPADIPSDEISFQDKQVYTDVLMVAFKYFNECLKKPENKFAYKYLLSRMNTAFSEDFIKEHIDQDLIGYNDGQVWPFLTKEFPREAVMKTGLFTCKATGTTQDMFKNRIMFPYWKYHKIIYAIGRAVPGKTKSGEPKYSKLLTRSIRHPYSCAKNVLWNDESVNKKTTYFIIGEGILEGYMCKWMDIPFVSPITKQFSKANTQLIYDLASKVDQVFIVPDNEVSGEGDKGALKSAETLIRTEKDIRIVVLPRKDDEIKIDLVDHFNSSGNKKRTPEGIKAFFLRFCHEADDYLEFLLKKVPTNLKTQSALVRLDPIFQLLGTTKIPFEMYLPLISKRLPSLTKTEIGKRIKKLRKTQSHSAEDEFTKSGYRVEDCQLFREIKTAEGIALKRISNFYGYIDQEIIYDNGRIDDRRKELKGKFITTGGAESDFKITAKELASDQKIRENIIDWAHIGPVIEVKEERHFANALMIYSNGRSEGIKKETIYEHTGWTRDKSIYLYPGYSLNKNGEDVSETVTVKLPKKFENVKFSKLERKEIMDTLYEGVLHGLLQTNSYDVTLPCMATAFLPPIFPFLACSKKYMLWLHGTTGKQKTTLQTLFGCFYGNFNEENPLDTWKSTVNSLEKTGYYLKDALYLIDDFKNIATSHEHKTFIQNYADQTAKGRLDSSAGLREQYPVRGFVISTGEDLPVSEASVSARLYPIEIKHSGNLPKIDVAKTHAHKFKGITPDFIRWFVSNHNFTDVHKHSITVKQAYLKKVAEVMKQNESLLEDPSSNVGRLTTNMSLNYIGFYYFLNYLKSFKFAISEITSLEEYYKANIDSFIIQYANQVVQESPSHIFLSTLQDLLVSKRAYILTGGEDEDPAYRGSLQIGVLRTHKVSNRIIEHVFLNPTLAYQEVQKALREGGRSVQFSPNAIWKQLVEKGFITPGADGKSSTKISVGSQKASMLCFRKDVFFNAIGVNPENVLPFYKDSEKDKDGVPEEEAEEYYKEVDDYKF